jgi:hypothetical protein
MLIVALPLLFISKKKLVQNFESINHNNLNAFMKKICLLTILQIVVFAMSAQKIEPTHVQRGEPVNSLNDKQEYRGYTIRLRQASPVRGNIGSYGFDILKDSKSVAHHFQNPLPFSPKGIQKKGDAYKIGQWIITEYGRTGHWQNMIPPHVAKQLDIECN